MLKFSVVSAAFLCDLGGEMIGRQSTLRTSAESAEKVWFPTDQDLDVSSCAPTVRKASASRFMSIGVSTAHSTA